MDINSLLVLLKSKQNEDGSVSCMWDYPHSRYVDMDGKEFFITSDIFDKRAIYAPDSQNPLFTCFPGEMKLEEGGVISENYKSSRGYFKIGEILEIVRTFMEKLYTSTYSHGKYTFDDLYFSGLNGMSDIFEIDWEPEMQTDMLSQLMNMIRNGGNDTVD